MSNDQDDIVDEIPLAEVVPDNAVYLPTNRQIIEKLSSSRKEDNIFGKDSESLLSTYDQQFRISNPAKNVSIKGSKDHYMESSNYSVTPVARNGALRVFVSHSHADNTFCFRLARDLRSTLGDEHTVWCDMQERFHSGNVLQDKISGELRAHDIFIIVLSPEAMNSRQVRYELNIALDKNMVIVPILLSKCTVYTNIEKIRPISFFTSYDYAFQELLLALSVKLDHKMQIKEDNSAHFHDLMQDSEKAFANGRWHLVLHKVQYLIRRIPDSASLYRMHALSLFHIGYALLALEALDTALALVSDDILYPQLLEDYAMVLISLHRWFDLIRIVDEALQVSPGNARWLARQKQIDEELGQPLLPELPNLSPKRRQKHRLDTPLAKTDSEHIAEENSKPIVQTNGKQKRNVFISNTDRYERFANEFYVYLKRDEMNGLLDVWNDKKVKPGENRLEKTMEALENAKITVLFVSQDFLVSDFIVEKLLPPLLTAAAKGETTIIPVIVGPCEFDNSSLAAFHPINSGRDLKSLGTHEREKIWLELAKSIKAHFSPALDQSTINNQRLGNNSC